MKRAESLGRNLRYHLDRNPYSQTELAEKLGVSRMTINNYLNGKSEIPLEKIYMIAEILNIMPEHIDFSLDKEERTRRIFRTMKYFNEEQKQHVFRLLKKTDFDIDEEVRNHSLDWDDFHTAKNLKYYMRVFGYNQMKLSNLLELNPNKMGNILRAKISLGLKEIKIASKIFEVAPSDIDMNLYDDPRLMQVYLYSLSIDHEALIDLEGIVLNIYHSYILEEGWDNYEE
ncbi:helix-turn-helix domain-containing protein [Salinicoccus sp. Marseille-QA3877]